MGPHLLDKTNRSTKDGGEMIRKYTAKDEQFSQEKHGASKKMRNDGGGG